MLPDGRLLPPDLAAPGPRTAVATAVLVAAALVAVATVPSPALAAERSDSVRIEPRQWASIELAFQEGGNLELGYVAEVTDGPRIDVLLLDNANHQRYEDEQGFEYHEQGSDLDTSRADRRLTLPKAGTWWIVLDHTSEGGASPPPVGAEPVTVEWTVRTGVDAGGFLPGWSALAVVTALGGAVLVARAMRQRRQG